MKRMRTALMLLTLANTAVQAAPFRQTDVPAGAKWFVHIDGELARNSKMCGLVDRMRGAQSRPGRKFIKEKLGMDVEKDIESVTLYGMSAKKTDAVAIIRARMDNDKVMALLEASESHAQSHYGTVSIHTWADPRCGKPGAMAFADENTIVLSSSEARVKAALDVLDHRAPSLDETGEDYPAPSAADGMLILAHAAECSAKVGGPSHGRLLSQADNAAFALAEVGDRVAMEIELGAGDPAKLAHIENMVRGMASFMILRASMNDAMPPLDEMLTVSNVDGRVTANLSCTIETAETIMKSMKANGPRARIKKHRRCTRGAADTE